MSNFFVKFQNIFEGKSEQFKGYSKYKGKVANELLKDEVSNVLKKNSLPFKVSEINAFVAGSKFEYDLLILKDDANSDNFAYKNEDVKAIIECKVNGLYDPEKNTDSIAKAINEVRRLNKDVAFGYVTFSEVVPKKETSVHYWDLTKKFLHQKVTYSHLFAVTLRTGNKVIDSTTPEDFEKFILKLCSC